MSKINNKFKKTEIGNIPVDWQIDTINNTSTLHARIGWQGLTTREYLNTGEYMLISGVNFNNGKVDWDSCFFVDANRYNQDKNIQIRPNDILVTKDGTIGKVAYIGEDYRKATLNSGVFVIRPLNSAYYPQYMYYVFMSKYFKKFLEKLSAGSTIVHLYQKDFVHFKFPLPPYEEQQKIASVLSDMDELVESLEKIIDKKKKVKQAAMQQLLTGKKRLPGFAKVWQKYSLSQIGDFVSGSGFPIKYQSNKNGEYPFYKVSDMNNIGNSKYMVKANNYINRDVVNKIGAKILPKGTVVFAKIGAAIELERKRILKQSSCIDNNMMGFIPNPKYIDYRFIYLLLCSTNLSIYANTTALPSLSATVIGRIEYNLPSLDEQSEIVDVIFSMDSEIELLERKLEKYIKIKEGMMQQLLTGRVRLA